MITKYTDEQYLLAKGNDKLELQCEFCGKSFFVKKRELKRIGTTKKDSAYRFCSRSCLVNYSYNINHVVVYCKTCGKTFFRTKSQMSENNFCSHECYGKFLTNKKRTKFCENCGKPLVNVQKKYCSKHCQKEHAHNKYISLWKNGTISGAIKSQNFIVSEHVRKYIFNKYNNSCAVCGWSEINKFTNLSPLQIHHIDGDCTNQTEENLILLCPNCHSLTENFGSRNRNGNKERTKYFCKN